MNEKRLPLACLKRYPDLADRPALQARLAGALEAFNRMIVVLDDDPTGVQTVHDIYVYTNWSADDLLSGFQSPESMFFVLTNSRGFSHSQTVDVHRDIAHAIAEASERTGKDFIVISRSDSTLRGHYPAETQALRKSLEAACGIRFDGEILIPFFREGGRYTLDDVHYVAMGDELVPAGETEFARDRTFGYHASNLREYIEEKHQGTVKARDVVSVGLEELRTGDADTVVRKLMGVTDFGKVIVNALDYSDLEVFALGFIQAVQAGKRFMFRSAAGITKVLGGVSDRPLLEGAELADAGNKRGGLVVVGSHVNKTTRQLEQLMGLDGLVPIEFDVRSVLDPEAFAAQRRHVLEQETAAIAAGRTAVVYTSRQRLDADTGNAEDDLRLSLRISEAVTGFVGQLEIRPSFIVAKGGITSSEIGTKGLAVRRALVLGQILPGIPVWQTGQDSKFPGLPYVIFPGNVGGEDALREAVQKLRNASDTTR